MASAYQTTATGSGPYPVQRRMGLPGPSSIGSPTAGNSLGAPPRRRTGMQYTQPQARTFKNGRPQSVGETLSQREGNKNMYYTQTGEDVPQGMQIFHQGWNTSGVGPGTRGYQGSGVIGSAAGAVGSAGVPTSQRGKLMKYGQDAMDDYGQIRTTDDLSDQLLENNGLSQSWRYGNMGAPPPRRYTNTNPVQTQSIRGSGGGNVLTNTAFGPMRRMGEMINKYLSR